MKTMLTVGLGAGVVLLGAGLVAGLVNSVGKPGKPRAAVVYHVDSNPTVLIGGSGPPTPIAVYKPLQTALVRNPRTLAEALKDPAVQALGAVPAEGGVEWLAGRLTVDPRGESEFFAVVVEGNSPGEAMTLLAAIDRAYRAVSYERDNAKRLNRRAALEREHKDARGSLEEFHARIDGIARRLGSRDALVLATIDKFRQQNLETALAKLGPVKEEYAAAVATLAAAKWYAGQVARRPAVLALTGGPWAVTFRDEPRVVPVAAAQAEVDRLDVESKRATKRVEDIERELGERNRYKMDLETLYREIGAKEGVANRLAAELETMRIEGNAPPRVTLSEDPFVVPAGKELGLAGDGTAGRGTGVWAWAGPGLCSLLGGFVGAAVAVLLFRRSPVVAARPAPPAAPPDYSAGVS